MVSPDATRAVRLHTIFDSDNHHHLICRGCGTMFDIECAVGATPCLTADDDHGFEIDEAEVIYWGRCPSCRKAAADAAGTDQE